VNDSGAEVVKWFQDHGDRVRVWLFFSTFALVLIGVYAGIIRGVLPAPYRDVFIIGAIALIVETAAYGWFWGGLALHAEDLEPATARTMLDVASYWGPVLTGTVITMLAPVAILALRRQAGLPRWLGVLLAVAVVEQVVETVTIFGERGFIAPGGELNLVFGAALVSAAAVALGIVVARSIPD
jgi:hypothetical protein